MTGQFIYDVFLRHNALDKAAARKLAERLHGDGLKVWFDEWAIPPGGSIFYEIAQGLQHSRKLVLLMSAHTFASAWRS